MWLHRYAFIVCRKMHCFLFINDFDFSSYAVIMHACIVYLWTSDHVYLLLCFQIAHGKYEVKCLKFPTSVTNKPLQHLKRKSLKQSTRSPDQVLLIKIEKHFNVKLMLKWRLSRKIQNLRNAPCQFTAQANLRKICVKHKCVKVFLTFLNKTFNWRRSHWQWYTGQLLSMGTALE